MSAELMKSKLVRHPFRPSTVSKWSVQLMRGFLLNFSCCLPWDIRQENFRILFTIFPFFVSTGPHGNKRKSKRCSSLKSVLNHTLIESYINSGIFFSMVLTKALFWIFKTTSFRYLRPFSGNFTFTIVTYRETKKWNCYYYEKEPLYMYVVSSDWLSLVNTCVVLGVASYCSIQAVQYISFHCLLLPLFLSSFTCCLASCHLISGDGLGIYLVPVLKSVQQTVKRGVGTTPAYVKVWRREPGICMDGKLVNANPRKCLYLEFRAVYIYLID